MYRDLSNSGRNQGYVFSQSPCPEGAVLRCVVYAGTDLAWVTHWYPPTWSGYEGQSCEMMGLASP